MVGEMKNQRTKEPLKKRVFERSRRALFAGRGGARSCGWKIQTLDEFAGILGSKFLLHPAVFPIHR